MSLASNYLTTKLMTFIPLTVEEQVHLQGLQSTPISIKRGEELLHQGEKSKFGYVLHSGWGCSFKVMRDGGRQVITFPIPGDCIGMRSLLLRTSDHAFSSLTDAVVSRIEAPRMLEALEQYPRLAAAILWSMSRDEVSMAETNCARWRGKSVPVWLREKGHIALGSGWFVGVM